MNALIKVIITTIIGFVGPLEKEEKIQAHTNVEHSPLLEILYIDPDSNIFCQLEELSCKKLNNNISS